MKSFLTQQELNDIVEQKDLRTLEMVLNRVVLTTLEEALRHLPVVTSRLLKNMGAIEKMAEKFIADNPSFKGSEDVVQKIVLEVEGENPGKNYDEVLALAKPKIEEVLRLAKAAELPFKVN